MPVGIYKQESFFSILCFYEVEIENYKIIRVECYSPALRSTLHFGLYSSTETLPTVCFPFRIFTCFALFSLSEFIGTHCVMHEALVFECLCLPYNGLLTPWSSVLTGPFSYGQWASSYLFIQTPVTDYRNFVGIILWWMSLVASSRPLRFALQ